MLLAFSAIASISAMAISTSSSAAPKPAVKNSSFIGSERQLLAHLPQRPPIK